MVFGDSALLLFRERNNIPLDFSPIDPLIIEKFAKIRDNAYDYYYDNYVIIHIDKQSS